MLLAAQSVLARVVDGNNIMDQRMSENLCAITFDDGPSRNTPQLLDMLDQYGIPATFFLLGKQAELHPDIVRRIVAEGHEIGNHSYSHPNLRLLSSERKDEEIRRTDAILRSLGATPLFLRPPYGAFDHNTVETAESLGLSVVLWSLDSRDWKGLPPDYAKLRSTRGYAYPTGSLRGIFLFHDTHKSTVDDLPRLPAFRDRERIPGRRAGPGTRPADDPAARGRRAGPDASGGPSYCRGRGRIRGTAADPRLARRNGSAASGPQQQALAARKQCRAFQRAGPGPA